MKIIIGLTGPTGAGKSALSHVAEQSGFDIIDCDKVARKAVEKGTKGLKALADTFGKGILNKDGTLNREELAKIAFSSGENTELLNKTLLPHIAEMIKGMIKNERTLLDAPTLFESGLDAICDKTVAVLSDKETRLNRIINRDNIDRAAALLRIGAGKSDDYYIKKADYVIYNNDDIKISKTEMQKILSEIIERK